jgi:hypothetical protein
MRPAPVERDWMDASDQRFAYRCLPLNIANAHGWELLCASGFSAVWDGSSSLSGIEIHVDSEQAPPVVSHFGGGVLTFHVPCLFRTEPGFDLIVQGPINAPKDAIAPLSGVIETDWSPYTFTMNWLFTRPKAEIRFEKGEPFCHVFPIRRGELEQVEPELCLLSENEQLQRAHSAWSESRGRFISDLQQPGSDARATKWQKLYYRGVMPNQEDATGHRTRLRLKPFHRVKPEV